jgi:hypothetical protein
MTLDSHQCQVVAIGTAYAIALLERVPPHWLRPALLYDLHMALEKLTDEPAKPLKGAGPRRKTGEGAGEGSDRDALTSRTFTGLESGNAVQHPIRKGHSRKGCAQKPPEMALALRMWLRCDERAVPNIA